LLLLFSTIIGFEKIIFAICKIFIVWIVSIVVFLLIFERYLMNKICFTCNSNLVLLISIVERSEVQTLIPKKFQNYEKKIFFPIKIFEIIETINSRN